MTAGELNESAPYVPPNRWTKRRENWVPIITVLISLSALAVIVAQAIIYKQQLKIMEAQARTSENSFRISQRAYVGLASLTANLEQRQVVILLENLGRIPARNIRVKVWEYRVIHEQIVGMLIPFEVRETQLLPGSLKMRLDIPLTDFKSEEINAIRTKQETVYLNGTIQYDNGFGDSEATNFALEYSPPPHEGWPTQSRPEQFQQELQKRAGAATEKRLE